MPMPTAQGLAGLMPQAGGMPPMAAAPGMAGPKPQQPGQAAPSPGQANPAQGGSPMAGLGSVADRVAAYRGNPAPLQQRYAVSQDLLDLLALQKIKSDKEAAMRQMQGQLDQQQAASGQTVAQQRQQEVMDMTKNELAQQRGATGQMQQNRQQNHMQQLMGGVASAPGANLAAQPKFSHGGIIGFADGGMYPDPNDLDAQIARAQQALQEAQQYATEHNPQNDPEYAKQLNSDISAKQDQVVYLQHKKAQGQQSPMPQASAETQKALQSIAAGQSGEGLAALAKVPAFNQVGVTAQPPVTKPAIGMRGISAGSPQGLNSTPGQPDTTPSSAAPAAQPPAAQSGSSPYVEKFLSANPELRGTSLPINDEEATRQIIRDKILKTMTQGVESDPRHPDAVSSKGAQGPYQGLASTAAKPGYGVPSIIETAQSMGVDTTGMSEDNPSSIIPLLQSKNGAVAAKHAENYLYGLAKQYGGNLEKTLRAYNEGPGAVNKGTAPSASTAGLASLQASPAPTLTPWQQEVQNQVRRQMNIDPEARAAAVEKHIRELTEDPAEVKRQQEWLDKAKKDYEQQYNPEQQKEQALWRFLQGMGGRVKGREFEGGAQALNTYMDQQKAEKWKQLKELEEIQKGIGSLAHKGKEAGAKAYGEGLKDFAGLMKEGVTAGTQLAGQDERAAATHERTLNAIQMEQERLRSQESIAQTKTEAERQIQAEKEKTAKSLAELKALVSSRKDPVIILEHMSKVDDHITTLMSTRADLAKQPKTLDNQNQLTAIDLMINELKQLRTTVSEDLKAQLGGRAATASPQVDSDALKAAVEKNLKGGN